METNMTNTNVYSTLTTNLMDSVSRQSQALLDIAAVMHVYEQEIPDHVINLVYGVIKATDDHCGRLVGSIEKELLKLKDGE